MNKNNVDYKLVIVKHDGLSQSIKIYVYLMQDFVQHLVNYKPALNKNRFVELSTILGRMKTG